MGPGFPDRSRRLGCLPAVPAWRAPFARQARSRAFEIYENLPLAIKYLTALFGTRITTDRGRHGRTRRHSRRIHEDRHTDALPEPRHDDRRRALRPRAEGRRARRATRLRHALERRTPLRRLLDVPRQHAVPLVA